jgi:hypothetical protein
MPKICAAVNIFHAGWMSFYLSFGQNGSESFDNGFLAILSLSIWYSFTVSSSPIVRPIFGQWPVSNRI